MEMQELERWDAKCARLEHSVAQLHTRHAVARRKKLRQFACADACALLKLAVNALLALLFAVPTLLYLAFRALRAAFRAARRTWRGARAGAVAARARAREARGAVVVRAAAARAGVEAHTDALLVARGKLVEVGAGVMNPLAAGALRSAARARAGLGGGGGDGGEDDDGASDPRARRWGAIHSPTVAAATFADISNSTDAVAGAEDENPEVGAAAAAAAAADAARRAAELATLGTADALGLGAGQEAFLVDARWMRSWARYAAQQPMRCPMGSGGLRVEKQRRGGLFSAES